MRWVRKREFALLFLGDLFFLSLALYVTLLVRYFELPSLLLLESHFVPFSLLFFVSLLVFFITGLYDQHTMIFRARLPERIFRVQLGNVIVAALFFFSLVPVFGITPKTNLVLYLLFSFGFITAWRLALVPRLLKRRRRKALLIGGGSEFKQLMEEVSHNARYPFYFSDSLNIDHTDGGSIADQVFTKLKDKELAFVIVDLHHRKLAPILPHLYKPIFSNVAFIDFRELYEEIFEHLPLSVLSDPEFVEHMQVSPPAWYFAFKRIVDIGVGIAMGIVTVVVTPFIWIAMRLEGRGPLFIKQHRIGKDGTPVTAYKFRSMREHDHKSASWVKEGQNGITRVGSVLRKLSLDEFPQFLNILSGEISAVGPRNDIEGLGKRLAEAIPHYMIRYSVKPGITGWAQINQRYEPGNISPQSVEETKMRLMYDLYYIRRRSFMLDIIIALKTLKRMVFRVSSW